MCLYISKEHFNGYEGKFVSKELPHPFIAKEHIPVYKILVKRRQMMADPTPWDDANLELVSPYLHMIYKRGMGYICIPGGFEPVHSRGLIENFHWKVEYGLHSFTSFDMCCMYGYKSIYKMYIPQGARYYRGMNNDIVSDKLMFPTDDIEWDRIINGDRYTKEMFTRLNNQMRLDMALYQKLDLPAFK